MKEMLFKIEVVVSAEIFNMPKVANKLEEVLVFYEREMNFFYDKIKEFVNTEKFKKIPSEELYKAFRIYFLKFIAAEAIRKSFIYAEKTDLVENIIDLLTVEMLKRVILMFLLKEKKVFDEDSYTI